MLRDGNFPSRTWGAGSRLPPVPFGSQGEERRQPGAPGRLQLIWAAHEGPAALQKATLVRLAPEARPAAPLTAGSVPVLGRGPCCEPRAPCRGQQPAPSGRVSPLPSAGLRPLLFTLEAALKAEAAPRHPAPASLLPASLPPGLLSVPVPGSARPVAMRCLGRCEAFPALLRGQAPRSHPDAASCTGTALQEDFPSLLLHLLHSEKRLVSCALLSHSGVLLPEGEAPVPAAFPTAPCLLFASGCNSCVF